MTKFLTKISLATLSAAIALASAPVALQAQTTTTTVTPTPSPTPTPSGCISGCIPTLTTAFFAGAAGTTRSNAALQGGYLTKDANGNPQIVSGPGLTYTGKVQTDEYNHIVAEGGVVGRFCSTCVDTNLLIQGKVGSKSQASGMATSNVAGQALGIQSGTNAQVGFGGTFGFGGTTTTPTTAP